MNELKNKAVGCLIGGAAGDALGYTVEFLNYSRIVSEYGPKGITRYELDHNGVAEISDDTQMTLYTANGLLIDDIQTAYLEWLQTQAYSPRLISNPRCWISTVPEMYSQRAPGGTCLSALRTIANGAQPCNDSKGCGGIMRVAPIAIWGVSHGQSLSETTRLGCYAAQLTHQHPHGFLPAGLMVAVLHQILESDGKLSAANVYEFVERGLETLGELTTDDGQLFCTCLYDHLVELRAGSAEAMRLAGLTVADDERNIARLGEGWTGEEAWYIALYCVLKYVDDFEGAIVAAVNHSGDSDSTGAIAGNLMGAIVGIVAIPEYYKTNLELRDVIEKMAIQLL